MAPRLRRWNRNRDSTGRPPHASNCGDDLADTYVSHARYSSACLETLLSQAIDDNRSQPSVALDLGVGTGTPGTILARLRPSVHLIGVDTSRQMLRKASTRSGYAHRMLQADAAHLPIKDCTADLVLSVSAFHLFADKRFSLAEMRRVAAPNAQIVIVDACPEDLATQLFHQFFPSFYTLESRRHLDQTTLAMMAESTGLHLVRTVRESFTIHFATAEHFLSFVSTRPFFGMRETPLEVFESEYRQCALLLQAVVGPIESRSALTAFILELDQT